MNSGRSPVEDGISVTLVTDRPWRIAYILSMGVSEIIASVSLLAFGGIVVGAGLRHLDREDRRWIEAARQRGCLWHQWQASEGGICLVCRLCGKKSRRLNPSEDRVGERLPFFP